MGEIFRWKHSETGSSHNMQRFSQIVIAFSTTTQVSVSGIQDWLKLSLIQLTVIRVRVRAAQSYHFLLVAISIRGNSDVIQVAL